MSKTAIWTIVIVVIIIILGFVFFSGNKVTAPTETPEGTTEETGTTGGAGAQPLGSLTVKLLPKGAAATAQSGTATLTEVSTEKMRVVVNVGNVRAGVAQPAHIHEGDCSNPGRIVFPLQTLTDGNSVSDIDTSLYALLSLGTKYSIAVHESTTNLTSYTACGDVVDLAAAGE